MADRLIFVRKKRSSAGKSEVIRVDCESYKEVVKAAHKAGISVSKAASEMIKFAIEHVDFVDEEDYIEGE
ncbi:hypothetical protein Q5O14_17845 [Eubacteriaceae bacterium ES2]|nr:hypothetical protein Q5O14_17845 [Eubacteriaceae bacterium ES2]